MWRSKDYLGFFSIVAIGVIMVLAFNLFEDKSRDTEAKERAESRADAKQAQIEEAAFEKKVAEIEKKKLELVSSYLKLPQEKVLVEEYDEDDDYSEENLYNEDYLYDVTAEGVAYYARFNKNYTKITKFVETPSSDSEYCSDSSTDSDSDSYSDSDSAHFPKIKTKKSKH